MLVKPQGFPTWWKWQLCCSSRFYHLLYIIWHIINRNGWGLFHLENTSSKIPWGAGCSRQPTSQFQYQLLSCKEIVKALKKKTRPWLHVPQSNNIDDCWFKQLEFSSRCRKPQQCVTCGYIFTQGGSSPLQDSSVDGALGSICLKQKPKPQHLGWKGLGTYCRAFFIWSKKDIV